VDSSLEASSVSKPATSQDFATEGSAGLPESTLLEQGLPDIEQPEIKAGQTTHFIGDFIQPIGTTQFFNNLHFDLALSTGWISNTGFEIQYKYSTGEDPYLWGKGGSGQIDPSSWSFIISGFSSSRFVDDEGCSTCPRGYLGPNTHISGALAGPMDFSQTGSGSLSPDYVSTNGYTVFSFLQSSYLLDGDLNRKSVVEISGVFDLSSVTAASVLDNKFELTMDLNNGDIKSGVISIIYADSSNQEYDYHIGGGVGSVVGDAFSVSFSDGRYSPPSAPSMTLSSVSLNGHFDSSSPNLGAQVLPGPGNQLNIVYPGVPPTPPNSLPTAVPIQGGQIIPSGSNLN
jgi:hypothetical protein